MTRSARTLLVSAVIATLSLAMLLPSAVAAPVAPATVSELPTSWAYGANATNWINITNTTGNYVGTIHYYIGVQVVLNQTNLTSSDTLVAVKRTIAFDYQASYCTPTCRNPSGEIFANYTAWQTAAGFVNFTTGAVSTPSGTVAALAVGNESLRVQGNLTERFETGYRNLFGTWRTGNDYLTVQANSSLLIGFNPALGLLPNNLTGVSSWTSSSTYTAAGGWGVDYAWAKNPILGVPTSARQSTSGSLTSTGTVSLSGFVGSAFPLAGATPSQSVSLVLTGPFDLRDGVLFLPIVSDVFQSSSTQTWSAYADAVGPASTSSINVGAQTHHIGVLASATMYQPMATSSFATANGTSDGSILPAVTGPTQPSAAPQTLQAEPENVPYATGQSSCLPAGTCSGQEMPISGAGPAPHGLLGAVVVVLAVAVVAALVAVGVVGRRRQVPPPPPRNNAVLYPLARPNGPSPPGTVGAPGSRGSATNGPAPPDDPLSHLW